VTSPSRLSPLTSRLLSFALFNSLLVPFVLVTLTRFSLNDLRLQETYRDLLHGHENRDSWNPMMQAIEYVRDDGSQPLYTEMFFTRGVKFQYPPSSLLPLAIVRKLTPRSSWFKVLNLTSLIFLAITVVFTLRIFTAGLQASPWRASGGVFSLDGTVLIAAALLLALTFYPAIRAYALGQIQTWINALFTLALWCWIRGRQVASGILVGSICLLKPHFGLFLVWGALRRRWGFALALLLTAFSGICLSVFFFGWANHVDYLRVLSFMFRHGETYYSNQSINGLLNRFLFNGDSLEFGPKSFPPYHPWVMAGTSLSSLILILTALHLPKSAGWKGGAIDFCIVALAATMASSIAWTHHYGILLPIYAAAVPGLLENRIFGRATWIYVAVSYMLASNYFGVVHRLAETRLNVLQSYLYVGALLLLICLHVLRAREGRSGVLR